jgi:hypothetical protein
MARLGASHEGYLGSMMLVPKFKPALFFRAMPLIFRDMRKRTGLVDMPFETIEFQRLLQSEANQDAIAVGIHQEIFIIVDHGRMLSTNRTQINAFWILT